MKQVIDNFTKMMTLLEQGKRVAFTPAIDFDGVDVLADASNAINYIHIPVGSGRVVAHLNNGDNRLFDPTLKQLMRIKGVHEYAIDWLSVGKDTPVVRISDGECFHFAKYSNGIVYVYPNGKTSYTSKESDTLQEFVPDTLALAASDADLNMTTIGKVV